MEKKVAPHESCGQIDGASGAVHTVTIKSFADWSLEDGAAEPDTD
jgi:hypothetical protein